MHSKKFRRRVLPIAMAAIMVASCFPAMAAPSTSGPDSVTPEGYDVYLDYSEGIEAGAYKWVAGDAEETYYYLVSVDENGETIIGTAEGPRPGSTKPTEIGAFTEANVTHSAYQNLKVYVPAEYLTIKETKDKETGEVISKEVTGINYTGTKSGYSAITAPVVFQTNNGSWKSGTSDAKSENLQAYLDAGFVYVSCGSRSRNAVDENGINQGKSPAHVVDLKAGVIALRANNDVIPGDMNKIFSTGNSGAGQSSTILGASGDMEEYYPYLAEAGAIGVTETSSVYSDAILGMYATAQIADIENADMAYAWWRSAETSYQGMGGGGGAFTEFQLQLQEDLADAYVDYLNGLGFDLKLDGVREGSYYDAILQNMTDAINVYLAKEATDPAGYIEYLLTTNDAEQPWIEKVSDTEVKVIDLDGWVLANGTVSDGKYAPDYSRYDVSPTRNKNVTDFDGITYSGENDAFGKPDEEAVHYSDSVSAVLNANIETYKTLAGYADVADSVTDYLTIDDYVKNQADLMNAMEILNPNVGLDSENPAKYWRTRNGVQDQHTSFSIAYNSCLAAEMAGCEVDYALVWGKEHNDLEKDAAAVAEFVAWVKECSAKEALSDPYSDDDATVSTFTYTVDGKDIDVTRYMDYYLADTGNLTDAQYENAKVNVYVPENATVNSPILYMVDNSGWQSNGFSTALLSEGVDYDPAVDYPSPSEQKAKQAAYALSKGYIVVDAGLRSRNPQNTKSPVTVADAKAVIRYLRHNDIGDTDKIFITGTSGGGALSAAIGSNGNSADFYPELAKIGAAGMTNATTSTINDDVYGVIAYCPITDLGHADGSYEYIYAGTRQDLLASGYKAESKGFSLSKTSVTIAPILAEHWEGYVKTLGLKNEAGKDLVAGYDVQKLEASGTFNDGMKVLLMAGLQEGLDELGYDAFVATLKERAADKAYVGGTPENGWQTSWITFSADKKTIKDIDLDGYYYYVALGQSLKPGIAFTNQGVTSYDGLFFNENNLFGLDGEAYGYNLKEVYELSNLPDTYGTWEQYWETHGDLIEKQMRMVDSIAYLVDAEDGDTAPYWYVRHGSNDRDTSFANQTLLYYALLNEKSIKTIDFKFAFDRGHEGSYDIVDADTFMTKSIGGKAYRPVIDNASDLKPGETSPQTGAASGMLPMVIASIAAVAGASVRGRKIR